MWIYFPNKKIRMLARKVLIHFNINNTQLVGHQWNQLLKTYMISIWYYNNNSILDSIINNKNHSLITMIINRWINF